MNKEESIEKFFTDLTNRFKLNPDKVLIHKGDDAYVIGIYIKEIDADDPVVNEFYLEIKKIGKELGYLIDALGDNIFHGSMKGVSISMNHKQYEELIDANLFRSILGKRKFNI